MKIFNDFHRDLMSNLSVPLMFLSCVHFINGLETHFLEAHTF